jgi:riboflavin kinase/FMN adenylyltransferase
MLGSWDPFAGDHARVMGEMVEHAHAWGLAAVAIMIDPAPYIFIHGTRGWPVYDDAATRARLLRDAGIDAVGRLHFTAGDLNGTAEQVFDEVCAHVELAEFWLGSQQTVGPGGAGSHVAVQVQARRRGMGLRVLPPDGARQMGVRVRSLLAEGSVAAAAELVGRVPALTRPAGDTVRLGWAPGRYRVTGGGAALHEVVIAADDCGDCAFRWPSPEFTVLHFVAGPGDAAGRAA